MTLKILCFILLLTNVVHAQVTVSWYNYPGGVAVATNNSLDVYSVNWDYNPGGDITLTKRDSSGNILWEAAFDNTDNTRFEVSTWVDIDSNGDIFVSGTIRSGISNPVDAASVLMKFSSSGALLWRSVFENAFDGSSTRKLLIDSDDNIYVFGIGAGPTGHVTKVKKFDTAGSPLWSYYDTLGIGSPVNIKFTPDSNLLIITRTTSGNLNGFLKIDLNGNEIWSATGFSSNTVGDASGDAFGNTYLINGEYVITNSGSVLQKISPAGTFLWADTNAITAFRAETGTDNNPVICGFPNSGTPGASFIKYDSSGNILWQNLDADGPAYALLLHAQMKLDATNAAYLAAGTLTQMAICKINSDGSTGWTAVVPGSYANSFDFTTGSVIYVTGGTTAKLEQSLSTQINTENTTINANQILVSPNPLQSLASINYSINERTISSLSIVDVLGNIQTKLSMNDHHPGENVMIVDLSELKPGIYFCKLISGELTLYTKFIKT